MLDREVTEFIVKDRTVTGVRARNLKTKTSEEFTGTKIICNIDPQQAAKQIGLDRFSPRVRRQLNYEYSPSNYMAYCVVKDLDLRDYGFGKWNTFHSGDLDLNRAFDRMYYQHDYTNPTSATSLGNFYFCNASSGYPGFAPTFWTGASLYQQLSGDIILG